VIDKLRLLFYLRVCAKSIEGDKIGQADRPPFIFIDTLKCTGFIFPLTVIKVYALSLLGLYLHRIKKFYPEARSSGATLKIFAHKKYASPLLDIQDENKIILPIILLWRGMQIQRDAEKRTYARVRILYEECIFATMNYCKWVFISIYFCILRGAK